jgi:hypothetical protein
MLYTRITHHISSYTLLSPSYTTTYTASYTASYTLQFLPCPLRPSQTVKPSAHRPIKARPKDPDGSHQWPPLVGNIS